MPNMRMMNGNHPQRQIQQRAQANVPRQGQYNGNPNTVYNKPLNPLPLWRIPGGYFQQPVMPTFRRTPYGPAR